MNKANVDALRGTLERLGELDEGYDIYKDLSRGDFRRLAEYLGGEGVLVPSALFPQECMDIVNEASIGDSDYELSVARFRPALERAAKGEAI